MTRHIKEKITGSITNADYATSAGSATSATSATNADKLDGYHGSSSQQANTYVLRDGNGYSYHNYINSNTGNNENPTISQIIVTNGNDSFYRKASLSHLKSSLGSMPASDVYSWAKASSKPSYTASEVGAAASSHTHNYAGSSSAGGNANWANGATYANYSYNDKPITTAGTGAAYTASVSGLTLVVGASFVMVPHTVSTTTAPTLNVNSLGAKNIRMRISSSTSATVALPSAAFLAASKPVRMVYDGTYWVVDDLVMPDANNTYGTLISRGTAAPTSSTAGYIYIQTT